jgi:C-terminal processing protease CtpA/Prc
MLEGNIGYLRLTTMSSSESVREIREWMARFRTTSGLINDVRDNTGGDRDALQLIYSYLAAPDDPPRVFTAAAYRLHPTRTDDYLVENHRMYRADAAQWSAAQLRAVRQFAKSFTPAWSLPSGEFSELHYMALIRVDEPGVFHYDRPTIVLMNGRSFSATDIFLAGLKGMKGVVLLGTASAGGSAYTQQVALGATTLRLRIGSMVSFQADGRLFDGHGVQPDILVEPTPEYYIGRGDNVLAEALKRLSKH